MLREDLIPSGDSDERIDAFVRQLSTADFQIFIDYVSIPNKLSPTLVATLEQSRTKYGADDWRRVMYAVDELREQLGWHYRKLQPELLKKLSESAIHN
jgi:hypothetical protein